MPNGDKVNRRTFLKSATLSIGTASMLPGRSGQREGSGPSLVQRLGYAADARVVIFTSDEFGQCHAANVGVMKCWEAGILKSATWMAPGPWAPEAAEYARGHPKMDVGVHLTLTGSLTRGPAAAMSWRPFLSPAEAPGLYTPDGYLWPNGVEAWKHATADEIKRESRAQIEHALRLGIDPTHLDPHDGIREANLPEFAKLYAELAKEFSLPVRMPPTQARLVELGQPGLRAMISRLGVLMSDESLELWGRDRFRQIFRERAPGTVTDLYIHPASAGPEIEAARKNWKDGVAEFELFTRYRDELQQAIKEEGFIVIGWREIRELQRHGG